MCSQYAINTRREAIEQLGIKVRMPDQQLQARAYPNRYGPVIIDENGPGYFMMHFNLTPRWSKEIRVKYATYNARVETVTEKPAFKAAFREYHCVVPMTSFYESAYEGPLAGNIIRFSGQLLFAAGIFDKWTDASKLDFNSFSILTREPSEFIRTYGHDRTPVFIKPEYITTWLGLVNKDPEYIRDELLQNAIHPTLNVDIERPLKAGWEKKL